MELLAFIGIGCCLAQALNLIIIMALAMKHRDNFTLNFNKFHEYWAELTICIASFGLGVWGFIYLISECT